VRISKRDDLAAVAGIGEDLLIARHGSVEDDLGDGMSICADGDALEDGTVRQGQNCGRSRIRPLG